ncbi:MAG TPA: dUTP diphosphatase [Chloroflexota bacterium]
MRVPVTRVDPTLPLPEYATPGAAGFDFVCRTPTTVEPGKLAYIPANAVICVPENYVLIVALRSGTPRRKGLLSPGGIGVIDPDYCGPEDEIQIQVYNFTVAPVHVERGERIAQGILMPFVRCEWDETEPRSRTSRGGFGSTG